MKRGESVGPMLVGAITQSRLAIVIFSRNYASSSWCLDELVEIMEGMKENQQKVIPIFYEVDPSHVRKQMGYFGEVFDETCVGKTEEEKQAWRRALKDVAGIAGYASSDWDNESEMIDKVASDVTAVLGFKPSRDFDDFVGIGAHITEIKSKFILQSEQVKVIVLVGPAGIGKTTIARALYNQLSPGFPFNTFLENIRGSYEKPCGNEYPFKLRLHQHLLSQLLHRSDIMVGHLGVAQEMLSDKKVLVVLDEVDSWWQLEEMAKQHGWFGPGSIIIITTEDRKLLKALGLGTNYIYEMESPTSDESLQIFCQYAFGQKPPKYGFEWLASEITSLADNLPLGLKVMGSSLLGQSLDYWIDALPRLKSSLDSDIESTLRYSYDVLSEKDQELFLYVACFFDYFKVDRVKRCLEQSGLDVNLGIRVLSDKSLISIENRHVHVHKLLQQMGREIVKKQSLEPGKRKFLWDTKDISDVLEEETGTGTVLGIKLRATWSDEIQIRKSAFDGMNNLQFLKVYCEIGSLWKVQCLNCLPNKLRFINWFNCPLRFWPSKFSFKFLVELLMQNNLFEKLWEGVQPLPCLKLLKLGGSESLKEIPDLSKAKSLEKLNLSGCKRLLELTSSIGNATKLTVCKLKGCLLLQELPSSICSLINLEVLNLKDCSSLKKTDLSFSAIEEMSSLISTWSCLYKLDMSGCENLKDFPDVPASVVELDLCRTGIEEVPHRIENLFRLRKLFMNGCYKLKKISPNISKLENLEFLALCIHSYCEHDDEDDKDDKHVYGDYYVFEAIIKWGPDLKRSYRLRSDIKFHYILRRFLSNKALTSPISLRFRGIGFKILPYFIRNLSGLIKLDISECSCLEALPPLPGSLLSIDARDCKYLTRIDSSSFQNPNICLNFSGCFDLNQKARKLIQTSACKHAVLPGEEIPAHFTHRATSGSLTINLTPKSLPSSFRFKACILLSKDSNNLEGHSYDDDEKDENSFMDISCRVTGKQNGLTVRYGSNELHHMQDLVVRPNHLYIFEDSFSLNQDCPEAEETTFSELSFFFIVDDKTWKVKACGVQILRSEENADVDDEDGGGDDEDESGDDCEGAEDEENEDGEVGNGDNDDVEEDTEDDVDNIQEEEESGCDEDAETMSRKQMRL